MRPGMVEEQVDYGAFSSGLGYHGLNYRSTIVTAYHQHPVPSATDPYGHTSLPASVGKAYHQANGIAPTPINGAIAQETSSIQVFGNTNPGHGPQSPSDHTNFSYASPTPYSNPYLSPGCDIHSAPTPKSTASCLLAEDFYEGDANSGVYQKFSFEKPMSCAVPDFQIDSTRSCSPVTGNGPTIVCSTCSISFTGEYARGNLHRHMKTSHSNTKFPCEVEGCSRQYQRSDARLAHYRKRHPELQVPPSLARKA
ncbi:hypothetical protein P280DRAFT_523643 [Massarina eburnea CBS 473.64]|uniref:C2H2-type domain-containing protein n=1 Tax=Massarina eburnea CBS 473.64 TaxID=1395130 RepID=A0A6A6RKJ2_9PLEO|nr:hypothetical protein P280DRAFT_523643 [Massarina eburnea CBS 473.64]